MAHCDVLVGDCRDLLLRLPADHFHACITSPPYWKLRNYQHEGQLGQEHTPDAFVARLVEVFRDVRRVLHPQGTVWLNLGDCHATKAGGHPGLKSKDLIGIPWLVAFALRADGWWLRQDLVWHKSNAMPEPVKDRCTRAHEFIFMLSRSPTYHYDNEAIKEPAVMKPQRRLQQRSSDRDRAMRPDRVFNYRLTNDVSRPYETRNKRSVWSVSTKSFRGAHLATFPPDLIEPCVLAGCPAGGAVLDPFAGAGTSGLVALRHGRNATLLELNPDYARLAKARLDAAFPGEQTGNTVALHE